MRRVRVGVEGSEGIVGQVLVGRLSKHPYADLIFTSFRKDDGKGNRGVEERGDKQRVEVMYLALPAGAARGKIPELLELHIRIIDLSRESRLDLRAVYGLPELRRGGILQRDLIKRAFFVANPGCYSTSVILGLAPVLEFVETDIRVASVSGISGAGEYPISKDRLESYKIGKAHDHVKEMESQLPHLDVLFSPTKDYRTDRGIISVIQATLKENIDVLERLREFYSGERFIRIKDIALDTALVNGTNYCDLTTYQDGLRLTLYSAIDNLMKGAAGQAIQNMNLMCGFPEDAGLV